MAVFELARRSGVGVVEVDPEAARQHLDRFARLHFGVSAVEFERRYQAGVYDGVDTPALHGALAVRDLLR